MIRSDSLSSRPGADRVAAAILGYFRLDKRLAACRGFFFELLASRCSDPRRERRAAAFSALRCGLRPHCADYFADRDLAAVCQPSGSTPRHAGRQFAALAESLPPSPWFYTGGFENHPEWVDRIARRHRLWGVDAEMLRAVRDPIRVAEVLHRRDPCPAVRRESRRPASRRELAGQAAGLRRGPRHRAADGRQRPRLAVVLLSAADRGPELLGPVHRGTSGARLVGVTRQWIGIPGSPFAYRGSIGPWPIAATLAVELRELGDAGVRLRTGRLVRRGLCPPRRHPLAGRDQPALYGLGRDPRAGLGPIAAGRASARLRGRRRLPATGRLRADPPRSRVIAKLILYASRTLIVPEIASDEHEPDDLFAVRSIADVPWPGTRFEPGEPVMTLLARATNLAACRSRLDRARAKLAEAAWECQRRHDRLDRRPLIVARRRGDVAG